VGRQHTSACGGVLYFAAVISARRFNLILPTAFGSPLETAGGRLATFIAYGFFLVKSCEFWFMLCLRGLSGKKSSQKHGAQNL
jgi:hypothetical protein